MDVLTRLANSIVVPVVVLDKVEDAIPTANAMAAGGVDTMEITFRTACAPECIKAVAENCPDILVGAGTIVNLEQCKLAVEMGAKFIVSPGFLVSNQNRALLFNEDGTPTARAGKILNGTPMGRFAESEELLGGMFFLTDDKAASAVTGVILPIDCGFAAYSGV